MKTLKLFVLVLLVILVVLMAYYYQEDLHPSVLRNTIAGYGLWAPVVFILIYIVGTVLFLPGTILTITGGLIFGPLLGTVYNLIGATVGASLAFVLGRYLARDWVAASAGSLVRLVIRGIDKQGWRFIAMLRLTPVIPFNLLNYAFGVTEIRLSHYVIASAIFMLPGTIAYTYLGHAGAELAGGEADIVKTILIAIALLALLVFLPRFIKSLRKQHKQDL